jgi:hypothetical protein
MMDSLTYTQLLRRNRSFRRLWIGQVISELGNWFNFIAALGLVRLVSHAAPEVTTILLISRLTRSRSSLRSPAPSSIAGRAATVMIATDLLRVVVALGFFWCDGPRICGSLISARLALVLRRVLRSSEKRCGSKHHRRTRPARGQRADVFVALPVDVDGRGAWWLDRRTRWLPGRVHHQRDFVFWLGLFRVAWCRMKRRVAVNCQRRRPRSLYRGYGLTCVKVGPTS